MWKAGFPYNRFTKFLEVRINQTWKELFLNQTSAMHLPERNTNASCKMPSVESTKSVHIFALDTRLIQGIARSCQHGMRLLLTGIQQVCILSSIFTLTGALMSNSDYQFGVRLRRDREAAGLTVRQLAESAAINYSYITKIEKSRCKTGISDSLVRSLAIALGADEYEYLYLSRLIPKSLEPLLATDESREFVHKATSQQLNSEDWQALRRLLEQRSQRPPKQTRKPRSVA
jgi:transcriptional regulator with XRE-family HTH domain